VVAWARPLAAFSWISTEGTAGRGTGAGEGERGCAGGGKAGPGGRAGGGKGSSGRASNESPFGGSTTDRPGFEGRSAASAQAYQRGEG